MQEREEFLLPDDAYPTLQNAYVWREKIKRKKGCQFLGRLQRLFTLTAIGNSGASPWTFNLFTFTGSSVLEANKEIIVGSVIINIGATQLIDQGNGTLATNPVSAVTGTINYITGSVTITGAGAGVASTATFRYAPGLPVMGIRIREQTNNDQTIFFDQVYSYFFNGVTRLFEQFLTAVWSSSDSQFFWTANYWVGNPNNAKIFWVTNNKEPIRYTNGTNNWVDFTPTINVPAVGPPNLLLKALIIIPFRGRLVVFNTTETGPLIYSNRIRWAAIGTPFTTSDGVIVTTGINPNAWRDDIRGQGGFLDIPTSEDIVSVGFVRDNLVIYCENSTWQLRYTGRSIAPFQIEKVNSELGTLSTFGAVQFDTSLVGIGDKGIVECDSYKSELIDVKIPDLVYKFEYQNNGPARVHGIRDFENRLAYWIYRAAATIPYSKGNGIFPNQRLVYNYENDSWAIFDDSYTALGTFQETTGRTWLNTHLPWIRCNFSWLSRPALIPQILGGNQQGFIEQLDESTTNDISLSITAITSDNATPTVITSPNHNLETGDVIEIYDIPTGTPYASTLNFQPTYPINNVFSIILDSIDPINKFLLMKYNSADGQFTIPQLDPSGAYVGGGKIAIRDNFYIQSKKFNFIDQGQSILLGYVDILMDSTGNSGDETAGAISMNVYLDYNTIEASNTSPKNAINNGLSPTIPDTFFNSVIPTTQSSLNSVGGTKFWQRVYCSTLGNFLTLEYTFNNAQMSGVEQTTEVQIDAQILWIRPAGRITQI